ncbi:Dabb family protein [Bacillus sp. DJP31]|uniref:Dabb family protein n=1 Tax=Bacillus sp. DJP31 TaxID=3409789 RepID=UPI003BB65A9E
MESERIRHMAFFTLIHSIDSSDTEQFLKDGKEILRAISTVENFEVLRQVSPKTDFDFGFSMEFKSQEDYDTYNNHSSHQSFVEERWKVEVQKFQEIDYVIIA